MNTTQQLRYLEVRNKELQTENANLRHRLQEAGYHYKRILQAYNDALLLAMWAAGGIHPSRRYAALHGMSQRRWENATALLRQARILVSKRRWATRDAAIIERRLEQTRKVATQAKEAYKARHVRDRHK